MKATDAQVQRIVDELGFDSTIHADIRRALDPILNETAAEVLRKVWDAMCSPHAEGLDRDATRIACDQVTRVAGDLGVTL